MPQGRGIWGRVSLGCMVGWEWWTDRVESTLLEVKRMGDEVKNFWGKGWEGGNIWNVNKLNEQTNKQTGYFSPLRLPSPASIWGLLPCSIESCFVLFGCRFLEAYYYLKRKIKGEWNWTRSGKELGGEEGGDIIIRVYCMRKKFIFNKEKSNNKYSKIRNTTKRSSLFLLLFNLVMMS